MRLNDDDITTVRGEEPEGPADAGAGMAASPDEHDGGADGPASGLDERAEGPMDAGAGQPADAHVIDGGADGGI
jgi:hypothetical protein